MTQRRLTREEQREQTRDDLLEAAATVFARQGYHGTSVDQVAEAAGYTKGAVYSNFSSKEELFLALLDRHLEQAVATVAEVLAQAEPSARAALVAERRDKMTIFDRDWFLLETEFLLYAARNEDARGRLAERQRAIQHQIADLVRLHFADLGVEPRVSAADLARLLIAAGDGLTVMGLTDPEGLDTRGLMTTMLQLMEAGASA